MGIPNLLLIDRNGAGSPMNHINNQRYLEGDVTAQMILWSFRREVDKQIVFSENPSGFRPRDIICKISLQETVILENFSIDYGIFFLYICSNS